MDSEYDIFECLRDGTVKWHVSALGLQHTRLKLHTLIQETGGDYFALHMPTHDLILAMEVQGLMAERAPRNIFQIAYTEDLRTARAELLRNLGYGVISVIGNEAAKAFLKLVSGEFSLFVVGHAAPPQVRKEMFDWLKATYPRSIILALNYPHDKLPHADYNAIHNEQARWLSLVGKALATQPSQAV